MTHISVRHHVNIHPKHVLPQWKYIFWMYYKNTLSLLHTSYAMRKWKKKNCFFFLSTLEVPKSDKFVVSTVRFNCQSTFPASTMRLIVKPLLSKFYPDFTPKSPPPSDSCIAYLSISSNAIAHNLCALRISKTQTPLLKILPRFHIYNRPADSCITCVCDIFKCNRAIFMCFLSASRIWWTQSPILKIYADYTSDSHLMIQAPPDLANIIWWKCLLGALKKYKSRVPSTKIHQILPLGVSC